MNDRFQTLFSLPKNQYTTGAPIVIAAGDLLKDNQTGNVFSRIKLHNISDKTIKAIRIIIIPYDTAGQFLNEEYTQEILDLTANRDEFFGQESPFQIPNKSVRSYQVVIKEIVFDDNTTWQCEKEDWEPLMQQKPIANDIQDIELQKQFRLEYGTNCRYQLLEEKDLWFCVCGHCNHTYEDNKPEEVKVDYTKKDLDLTLKMINDMQKVVKKETIPYIPKNKRLSLEEKKTIFKRI